MLLPLQVVLLFSIRTPKALPWAMCFLGFQPVELSFDTPSYVTLYIICIYLVARVLLVLEVWINLYLV